MPAEAAPGTVRHGQMVHSSPDAWKPEFCIRSDLRIFRRYGTLCYGSADGNVGWLRFCHLDRHRAGTVIRPAQTSIRR